MDEQKTKLIRKSMNRQKVVESNFMIDDKASLMKNKLKNLINENQVLCQQI
jgi:hypothetical protein